MSAAGALPQSPLVGRGNDLAVLLPYLDGAAAGNGATVVLIGEGGVGKTRLAHALADEATRRGFRVAAGRAFPVETGVPYALFADAFVPVVRQLDPAALALATRGAEAELAFVLPGLSGRAPHAHSAEDAADLKTRLLWVVAEFVRNLAARQPLLLLVDDVHWADRASLELLHFLARQTQQSRVLIVCTYNDAERGQRPELRPLEQSLLDHGVARTYRITPLTSDDTAELVRRAFELDTVGHDFTELLYAWTRGNPFFVRETLQSLVDAGRLRRRDDGQWLGWEFAELEMPGSIREVIAARLDRLSTDARAVAEVAAAFGTRCDHELLGAVAQIHENTLLAALDELRHAHVLQETETRDDVRYEFTHPLLRQVLYGELGTARARSLHTRIAEALEQRYGSAAAAHADELAFHFARAGRGASVPKAVRYLYAAGRSALARFADREAIDYLKLALEQWTPEAGVARVAVMIELGRAHQRIGEYDAAIGLWRTCLSDTETRDAATVVALQRRLGQAFYWSGRHAAALEHCVHGTSIAQAAGLARDEVRLRLATGVCLQELGRADEARQEIDRARALAESEGDVALLARAHRALLLLHIWTGPPDAGREHGARAVELARAAGDVGTEFFAYWGLALLEGLTGHTAPMRTHIGEMERIAEQQRSPLLRLWTAELSIELATALGEWERGIATGEHAIALARALNQRTLLPRLLVWTAMIYLGRTDLERAKEYIDEAWVISGADQVDADAAIDVHSVLPAHIGRAAYCLTNRDFAEAIRICERGLAIADRTGYAFWAMHRLLPILAEAHCHLWDVEGALRIEQRIRADAERLGHKLGLAWADSCRALVVWLQGDPAAAAKLIREAAESLESIPILPDAARLRRQLAGRLADTGDREGALLELRRVHEAFARMGAESELAKARGMFREIGAKPPTRAAATGSDELTGRELEIARMVAERKSNKAIARALDISPRTVSTHISNIFRKLHVATRGELADYVRTQSMG